MVNRWIEGGHLDTLADLGVGCVAFSPLAQGLLTSKYLNGIPADARTTKEGSFKSAMLSADNLARVRALDGVARNRGQSSDAIHGITCASRQFWYRFECTFRSPTVERRNFGLSPPPRSHFHDA
jgi:hypothetical protein